MRSNVLHFILPKALIGLVLLGFVACQDQNTQSDNIEFKTINVEYPTTYQDKSVLEDYHGTQVADPYRWLEDDSSEETGDWVDTQNKVTFDYLSKIPYRQKIKDRFEKIWNFEKYGTPFKRGDSYYFFKNDGLQNQYVLYRQKGDDSEVVLDPNTFSDDGTSSLAGYGFSKNGKYLAYQISEGGSDWRTVKVLDLESGRQLEDDLEWVKFSGVSWYEDGFYYSRYPEPKADDELSGKNEYHAVYYHKLGDDQSKDRLVFEDKENPLRNVYAGTTDDERFMTFGQSASTSGNSLSFVDLTTADQRIVNVVAEFENDFQVIDNIDGKLLVMTNYNAPNQEIILIDSKNPAEANWKKIIPESEDALRGASIIGNKIFAYYLHDASSQVKAYSLDGEYLRDVDLPGIGSVGGMRGKKDSNEAFYSFSSYTYPQTIFKFDTETFETEVFRKPEVDFDPTAYKTEQVWYESYDGTEVPMFLTYKKDLVLDGTNPTLLYGYGGFDIAISPSFNITKIPMLENGGIYAVANIRGGGEFGKKWHEAGTKGQKQNVFNDFQAAAEYLIEKKYTSSEKLAIQGGSNGGLLVGACMTQRPDLFKVAFPAVGVLDMLRYHKFTIGWAWASDYGSSDNAADFDYLIKYSPLHNVKPAAYPATMITTADHDDRVVPAHSFKFAAELQKQHTGENPVLIRIEKSAGHGAGKPTSKIIEEQADLLSFMFYNMNEQVNFPVKG